jgi:drug/metabolite transporter (DMT)-like permease
MGSKSKGQLHIFLSCIFFAISAVLVKFVSAEFSSYFVSLFRFVIGIILGFAVLICTKQKFKVQSKFSWILRGITGFISMVLYYLAIEITSSGRATLLNNMCPVFVLIFGVLFFKEQVDKKGILGLVLCLIGVFTVFYDGNHYSILGDAIGLLSGIIMGAATHYTKESSQNEHPAIVYLSPCFMGLLLIPFSVRETPKINPHSFILLFMIGLASFLAQLFMTNGYKYVSATEGSMISYLKIPITIIFSRFLGEKLGWKFFIGTLLVMLGLYLNVSHKKVITEKIENHENDFYYKRS